MNDFSQLNHLLPVELDPATTAAKAPESSPDPKLFQALLAEAGYTSENPDAPVEGAASDVAAELALEVSELPLEELPLDPQLATRAETETEIESADIDTGVLDAEPAPELVAAQRTTSKTSPDVVARIEEEVLKAPQPVAQDSKPKVASPIESKTVAPVREQSGSSDPTPVQKAEETASHSRFDVEPLSPESDEVRSDADVAVREEANTRANASPLRSDPQISRVVAAGEGTGASPFVTAGPKERIEALNIERFDVRRIEFRTESVQPQGKASSPLPHTPVTRPVLREPVGPIPVRIRPLRAAVDGGAESAELRPRAVAPEVPREVPAASERQVPQSVLDAALDTDASTVAQNSQNRVTSEIVLKDLAVSRRDAVRSKAISQGTAVNTADADSSTPIVQMSSEVPRETNSSSRQAEPQQVAPPKPVTPLAATTFSLDPARRVTMQLGAADSEVMVQIREHQGEVSLRFDAPQHLRTGLEASVQSLVDSLSREQVPVSDVLFSGRFDTGTDSQGSHKGHDQRPNSRGPATPEAEDDLFSTEFATSSADGRINVLA